MRTHLQTYCFDRHGAAKEKGGVNYESLMPEDALVENDELMDLTMRNPESGEMPPAKAKKQPEFAERRAMVAWLETAPIRVAGLNADDPGPVVLPRLSPTRYANILRDWAGIKFAPSEQLARVRAALKHTTILLLQKKGGLAKSE